MTDRLLAFTFHLELGRRAPVVIAWPWARRRQVTLEALAGELAARLAPRDPAELGPYLRQEDVRRVLAGARIDDRAIDRVVTLLEQDLAGGPPDSPILAPRQPRWLSREAVHEGATVSFQVLEVAP